MEERPLHYTGSEITVTYTLKRCIHAAECSRGLPAVFDPQKKPWVNANSASADEVALVIERCPTGALKYKRHDGGEDESPIESTELRVDAGGPLFVRGRVRIRKPDGDILLEDTRVALCRCGASENKPFCDDSHYRAGFDDPGVLGEPKLQRVEADATAGITIVLAENGPLRFEGVLNVISADGGQRQVLEKGALCRCGGSSNKPYCDGTHKTIGFQS